MRSAGKDSSWSAREDVPESLGTAVAVRELLGLPAMLPIPGTGVPEPVSPASDEDSWYRWWCYVVSLRVMDYPLDQLADVVKQLAGDFWAEAQDRFMAQKLGTARSMARHPLIETDFWQQLTSNAQHTEAVQLDVVPSNALLNYRAAARHWVLSSRSRLSL